MKSLTVRVTLVVMYLAVTGVSSYLFWKGETGAQAEAAAARAFEARAVVVTRAVLDVRSGQQAYVAAGQGTPYWASKVTGALTNLREELAVLGAGAASSPGRAAVEAAGRSLRDFSELDQQAQNRALDSDKLAAADLIFTDGAALVATTVGLIEQAAAAETAARDDVLSGIRRRQRYAIGAVAAAALLALVLLTPRVEREFDLSPSVLRGAPARGLESATALDLAAVEEGWAPPRRMPSTGEKPVPARQGPEVQAGTGPAHPLDLGAIASVCTDLARIADTASLPDILSRAASVLDASGIVLWLVHPDCGELSPVVTHGYPPQVVARLGRIARDDGNATAAAYRTSLLQTVSGSADAPGAIAAPLVAPDGVVGVLAVEVRNAGEKHSTKLAVAAIVAAQLATLVGPPAAQHQKAGSAGL